MTASPATAGDIITQGQPIPANATVLGDAELRRWKRTSAGHWHTSEDAIEACEASECYEDSTWKMRRRYPLSVVDVEPEPQIAGSNPLDLDEELDELGPAEWAFQTLQRIAAWGFHDSNRDELRRITKAARERYRAATNTEETS